MITTTPPTIEVLYGPSPIDWCEPNRPQTNPLHVQELHNTWTNISYVIAGFALIPKLNRCNPLYQFYVLSIVMTGLTSAWFHATLIFISQKSDEFFENAAVVSLLYAQLSDPISTTKSQKANLFFLFSLHVTLLGLGVVFIPSVFCELHLITVVLATFTCATRRVSSLPLAADRNAVLSHFKSALLCAAAGFGCWMLDFFLCHEMQGLYLHAFAWHPLTALALYKGGDGSICLDEKLIRMKKTL